ncbi:MAG: hypothetical protein GY702_24255, partial [Desulfobulbaceae bacterium]|nr:hypothetical protein [Desulfobulbaceae bacterium]
TKELNKTSEKETKRIFRIGYVMRCVIPGSYTVPPAEVEDMYQPGYRARTEVKSIRIDE